jgi:hypothetical protein
MSNNKMTWEQIVEKQANEYKDHLNGCKKSLEQLAMDKVVLLKTANCKEENMPQELRDMVTRSKESWQEQWGMYGSHFKTMRMNQQKELNFYFHRQAEIENVKERQGNVLEKQKTR